MLLKRKIYTALLNWKESQKGRRALLVEGARRVGKSFIVEEFGKNEYESCLLINFSRTSPDVKSWFDLYLEDLDKLFMNLELQYGVRLKPRKSLIIFDEVQDCPRAREAIKFLVADGRFDYIETGSLVSIKSRVKGINLPSEELAVQMHPMDFEEFCWAAGQERLFEYVRNAFKTMTPMGLAAHRKAMDLFRLYLAVGGMPEVVSTYFASKSFEEADFVKASILQLYRNDIRKYADKAENRVTSVYDGIPGQLQRHEKQFRISALGENARMRDYEDAFLWLADAKVINCCFKTTEPSLGLKLNEDRASLKCYFCDTGLLVFEAYQENGQVPTELYRKLILGKLESNDGMLMENVVAQMLVAAGRRLFFFSSYSRSAQDRMEIDFLIAKSRITNRHNVSPIEVKSGKRYRLSSIGKFREKYADFLDVSYVLHPADLKRDGDIVFVPLYMAGLL